MAVDEAGSEIAPTGVVDDGIRSDAVTYVADGNDVPILDGDVRRVDLRRGNVDQLAVAITRSDLTLPCPARINCLRLTLPSRFCRTMPGEEHWSQDGKLVLKINTCPK